MVTESIQDHQGTDGGCEFQLPVEIVLISTTAEFIAQERICSPFFVLNWKLSTLTQVDMLLIF